MAVWKFLLISLDVPGYDGQDIACTLALVDYDVQLQC